MDVEGFEGLPPVLISLGIMHRMKWGCVDWRVVIRLLSCCWKKEIRSGEERSGSSVEARGSGRKTVSRVLCRFHLARRPRMYLMSKSQLKVTNLYLVETGYSLESGTLLAATALAATLATGCVGLGSESSVIGEDFDEQLVGSVLELVDDAVVERILVLLEPSGDVVRHGSGVMAEGEVGLRLSGLRGLGLLEVVRLAEMVLDQLVGEGLVGGLGEHRLFLEDGQDAEGLMK